MAEAFAVVPVGWLWGAYACFSKVVCASTGYGFIRSPLITIRWLKVVRSLGSASPPLPVGVCGWGRGAECGETYIGPTC